MKAPSDRAWAIFFCRAVLGLIFLMAGIHKCFVMTPLGQRLLSEIRAQKLAFVSEVVKDWKPEEIEAFGELFEKFISGFESVFEARVKDIADEA